MKASVIIPTKNPGPLFSEVLAQVLRQETDFEYEVLVIDSGSSDGTVEKIRSISDRRLRLHCIEPATFGHGRTRNTGVSMTSGEYAVLITHDALPTSINWLSALVSCAESDSSVAGVFGRHLAYPDADPFTKRELELHFSGFDNYTVVSLEDAERYKHDQGYRQLLHFFSDNNALIRRTVWEKIPYPDVDFAEDQLWAQKIIEAGYKKAYSFDACVYHSHNYKLVERLRRSFDESYAFKRFFGYTLCADFPAMIRSWAALSLRDYYYAKSINLLSSEPIAVVRVVMDNLMRITGHFLGARGDRLSERQLHLLSHDKRLMSGLRNGSTQNRRSQ